MSLLALFSLLSADNHGIMINGQVYGQSLQGSGKVVSKNISLQPFEVIQIEGSLNLIIEKGDTYQATVKTDDNLINNIEFIEQGSQLIIQSKESYSTQKGIFIHLITKSLRHLKMSGSINAKVKNLNEKQLYLETEGVSDLASESGSVDELTARLQGVYNVDLRHLDTQKAKVSMEGSGDLVVHVKDKLEADIQDNASLTYIGNPQITKKITDNGSIYQE